jgi:hypothetical protein
MGGKGEREEAREEKFEHLQHKFLVAPLPVEFAILSM